MAEQAEGMGMTELQQTIATLRDRLRADARENDHCTANPIFVVQQRRRIYGIDSDYAETFEWVSEDGETSATDEEMIAMIGEVDPDDSATDWRDSRESIDELIDDIRSGMVAPDEIEIPDEGTFRRIGYLDTWEYATAHFTREAAEEHIKKNGHNLRSPCIYVDSQYRAPEWCAVRDGIKVGDIVAIDRAAIYEIIKNYDNDNDSGGSPETLLRIATRCLREIVDDG